VKCEFGLVQHHAYTLRNSAQGALQSTCAWQVLQGLQTWTGLVANAAMPWSTTVQTRNRMVLDIVCVTPDTIIILNVSSAGAELADRGRLKLRVSFEWCLPHQILEKAAAGALPQHSRCVTQYPCNVISGEWTMHSTMHVACTAADRQDAAFVAGT